MRRARKAIRQLGGPSDPRHGTPGGYSYWGCRCSKCRTAATAQARIYRENAKIKTHGRGGYEAGCRCEVCRSAKRKVNSDQAKRSKDWRKVHQPMAVSKVNISKLA